LHSPYTILTTPFLFFPPTAPLGIRGAGWKRPPNVFLTPLVASSPCEFFGGRQKRGEKNMETNIKQQIWKIHKFLNELKDVTYYTIAETRELVYYYGRKLEVCDAVENHMFEGEESCPVSRYCYTCMHQDTCVFNKTYSENLTPQTASELHLMLYHKWRTLILLLKIYEIIYEIDRRLCQIEG